MKIKKRLHLFILGIVLFCIFLPLLVFASKMIYRHEHEINERLGTIDFYVQKILGHIEADEPAPRICDSFPAESYYSLASVVLSKLEHPDAYMKLACGGDINFLIVGDSISTADWTKNLSEWISYQYGVNCHVNNISMSGNTTYSGFARTSMLENNVSYDLALICHGQNDSGDRFSTYYESLIRLLLKNNPDISIISVLEASQREYTDKMQDILTLAEYYSIPVVDMIEAVQSSSCSYSDLMPDGVHPNELGGALYLSSAQSVITEHVNQSIEAVADSLEKAVSTGSFSAAELSTPRKTGILPQSSCILDSCLLLSRERFTRSSSTDYELEIEQLYGVVGLWRSRLPGDNNVRILLNEKTIFEYNETFYHSFSQSMIFPIGDDPILLDGTLKVAFGTPEQADAFEGLLISDLL